MLELALLLVLQPFIELYQKQMGSPSGVDFENLKDPTLALSFSLAASFSFFERCLGRGSTLVWVTPPPLPPPKAPFRNLEARSWLCWPSAPPAHPTGVVKTRSLTVGSSASLRASENPKPCRISWACFFLIAKS